MPDVPSDDAELDPIDVVPTDNSSGSIVDLNRVDEAEEEYRQHQPKDISGPG